ncbi:MAG: hypothetical protein R2824_10260 [Saprospiraceae bacterium]|nr:hypothetical protein [Lewinella sp.]
MDNIPPDLLWKGIIEDLVEDFLRFFTTLAILIDRHRKFHPVTYETELAGTRLIFRFNSYKLLDHTLEELQRVDNPFARVLEVARIALKEKKLTDEYLYTLTIGIVRRLKISGFRDQTIRQIMNFLRAQVRFRNSTIIRKFENEIDIIFENSSAMGVEEIILEEARKRGLREGKTEGKIEEKHQVIYHSWKEGLSPELAEKLTELPVKRIKELYAQFAKQKQ